MGKKQVKKNTGEHRRNAGINTKLAGLERFVALFDIHCGWERRYERGNLVEYAAHNDAAITAALDFVDDFEPHHIVLGGDQLNFGPVSHWRKGKPQLTEGFSVKAELDLFNQLVLSRIERRHHGARKIWMEGNHDAWLLDVVEENPALAGLVDVQSYLELAEEGWEYYSQGEIAQVGKCYFLHGDTLGPGRNVAARAVSKYRRNVRFGHFHHYASETLVNPLDVTDNHTGICVPALCERSPGFMKNAPNNWLNGFLYGYVDPETGNFFDNVVVMTDNKFVAEGNLYGK